MTAHPTPRRTPDGRTLASRHVVAYVLGRHVDVVRKRVPAVACDVPTRAALVDLEEADKALRLLTRRDRQAS